MVGFQQTDIGLIPKNWNLISYEKAFNFLSTASYSKAELIDDGQYKYIHYGVIHTKLKHFIDFHQFEPNSIRKEQLKSYAIIKEGDVIMADASEDYSGICKSVEVKNIDDIIAISGLHTFLLRDKNNNFCNGFKGYLHSNRMIKNQFDRLATGLKVYGVSKGNMKLVQIPLPPLPEQEAIAEVLSDTDALITALEKRIAKKQLIKKGAMQTLLTPKDDWEVKKLGEIGATFGGLSGKSKKDFADGNCPYIPFMNIMSNPIIDETYFDYVKIKKGESQNKATKGNLFFNGSSETPEEVGMCSILLNDIPNLYLNSFCFGFRLFKTANENGLFLVYYFRSNEGRKHFRLLAQGATRYNLSKTQLLKMEIALPSKPEQTRIATILSDMDSEINALEKKLSKTKELKQGLMQQLLTGKIRLI